MAIGSGMANTIAVLQQGNNRGTAADYAFEYINNGEDDWHLPSIDELQYVYAARNNSDPDRRFVDEIYWSSSEDSGWSNSALFQAFGSGERSWTLKIFDYRVRPVRAF